MLANNFLGGTHSTDPLPVVAELAISESNLFEVQDFIREVFEPLLPSEAHALIPRFCWRAIFTTNYDRLVEDAYKNASDRLQTPIPFVENGDRVESHLRGRLGVMLVKLHGCITRISNPNCPLILTIDQYTEYKKGRDRLFRHLTEKACEFSLIFVGHSMNDPDIRETVLNITSTVDERPRHYSVVPEADELTCRYWERKKVTILRGRFKEFLQAMDVAVPAITRTAVASIDRPTNPIREQFTDPNASISKALDQFLEVDVEYVTSVRPSAAVQPRDFYSGLSPKWAGVEQGLDVRRGLVDSVLSDHFLIDEGEHASGMELIIIKGHAGAGKSILLQRLAWDAAHEYKCFCLFLKAEGLVDRAAIVELSRLAGDRLYLFVDDVSGKIDDLNALCQSCEREAGRLTLISTVRTNEWNIISRNVLVPVHASFELHYLSQSDIDALIGLLTQHAALGNLEHLTIEERKAALKERAGRQLLVALHEATRGKRFEDIIEDEFRSIVPYDAQRIYLTICVLNRLGVPVRAGIISRMHGIPFDTFQERFFGPLERVVLSRYNSSSHDYEYTARHPLIAEMVFERVLKDAEERYDVYTRCLKALNLDYVSDASAFRRMIKANAVLRLFANQEHARGVFEAAMEMAPDDALLWQQLAIYEMKRPDGSLEKGGEHLRKAESLWPNGAIIQHSMAELALRRAEKSRSDLEEDKLLKDAENAARRLLRDEKSDGHAYHTLAKVGLRRLERAIQKDASEEEIERHIKDVEKCLDDGMQRAPENSYLMEADATLAQMLSQSTRAIDSLKKAFNLNKRNAFIAWRLSQCLVTLDDPNGARTVLEEALNANPGERRLHYSLARMLMGSLKGDDETMLYHLQRSFSAGDKNFDAQLRYGRELYRCNRMTEAKSMFEVLGKVRVGANIRDTLRYPLEELFHGQVARIEAGYCFVRRDRQSDWVYCHASNTPHDVWRTLSVGTRVEFRIGFTFRGANGFGVKEE